MASNDGIYQVRYAGDRDRGFGLILLSNGVVVGTDVGGIAYDGLYYEHPGTHRILMKLTLTVPAGISLVTGVPPKSRPYAFNIELEVPGSFGQEDLHTKIQTPYGLVEAEFHKLRNLPPAMAASA